MDYPTYAELKANLENQLDLNEETFITSDELLNYFNEAIAMIQGKIHGVYEDYFRTSANVALVTGTSLYDLPSDIYGQKIRSLWYNDGSTKYKIKQVKKLDDLNFVDPTDDYQFILKNASAAAGVKLEIYPPSRETSSTNVTLHYLRGASTFAADSDKCDIPEFSNVIIQYVRWKCNAKEMPGSPETQSAQADLKTMVDEMISSLSNRVVDEETELQMDLSFYRDFDTDRFPL